MKRVFRSTIVLGLCCVLGCARRSSPVESLRPVLSTARLYYDDGPAFRDSTRVVIRDVNRWQDIWERATSTQPSTPKRPEVDFGREMVILVAAGRMSPGDQIRVDSSGVRRGVFVVVVRTITDCRSMPTEVYPLEIVKVARSDKQETFIERRDRTANC